MSIKERVQAELERVQLEINANDDQERATLEGWEGALKWVLNQLEGESK